MEIAEKRSYDIKKVSGSIEVELERLKAQVELFWKTEFKHYQEFGLTDNMHIVEFGSGPGALSDKLLETLPGVIITGAEIDEFLVEYSKNNLKQKYSERFNVTQQSIMNTDFPDNTFDFAITRLVLEHLPDPVSAVKEVVRVLKPGGKAVFIDNDFEMFINTYPHVPELRDLYDSYCQCRYDESGNPKIGRELPVLLKKGGLSRISFEVICAHNALVGDELFSKSEGVGIPAKLVKDKYLDSKILGKIAINWRAMLNDPDHSILRQLYIACGEK